jgi:hypothetical protein
MPPDQTETPSLTPEQGYEAAYRFVAQYYERERIVPFMLMLTAMRPTADAVRTNDPASWSDWIHCVDQTLEGNPLPQPSPPSGEVR